MSDPALITRKVAVRLKCKNLVWGYIYRELWLDLNWHTLSYFGVVDVFRQQKHVEFFPAPRISHLQK